MLTSTSKDDIEPKVGDMILELDGPYSEIVTDVGVITEIEDHIVLAFWFNTMMDAYVKDYTLSLDGSTIYQLVPK